MSWLLTTLIFIGSFTLGYCLGREDLLDKEWQDCMREDEE